MPLNIVAVNYPPPGPMTSRSVADVTDFIVHHTAGATTQTALDIDAEHRSLNPPDAMIAYNWVITPDGTVYAGRPIDVVSAAAYGRNAQSVDVVLVGQFQPNAAGYTGPPTDAQLDSLLELGIYAHRTYSSICRTIGHRDIAPMFYPQDEPDYSTACPGDDLYAQLPDIKSKIAAAVNVH